MTQLQDHFEFREDAKAHEMREHVTFCYQQITETSDRGLSAADEPAPFDSHDRYANLETDFLL